MKLLFLITVCTLFTTPALSGKYGSVELDFKITIGVGDESAFSPAKFRTEESVKVSVDRLHCIGSGCEASGYIEREIEVLNDVVFVFRFTAFTDFDSVDALDVSIKNNRTDTVHMGSVIKYYPGHPANYEYINWIISGENFIEKNKKIYRIVPRVRITKIKFHSEPSTD